MSAFVLRPRVHMAEGAPHMSLCAPRSRGQRLLVAVLLVLGSLLVVLPPAPATAQAPPAEPAPREKIAPELLDRPENTRTPADGRVEAVVIVDTPAPPPAGAADTDEVPGELEKTAETTQAPVVDLIESHGDQVLNTFWLKNMVLVRVKPATLDALAASPLVERVIPNFTLTAPRAEPRRAAAEGEGETTWGIKKIGADRVRSERGLTGDGVRVAVLDTGVDITHPDLAGKLVSDDPADPSHPGGWIEFAADGTPVPTTPHDSSYHGTHVAGTIAGGDASGTAIGVAPGVELMAGLVIPGGNGTLAQVIAGMQWAIAPYDKDGEPAGEPADVVSMSLGGEGYSDEMIEPTRNILRAGAFPSFAIGNECLPGGSGSPGNVYDAVAVGATDVNDDVPDFSCGGVVRRDDWIDAPGDWPDTYVVPDISAPGLDVLSAIPGGGYGELSGTSMATPHVSGVVALMLQARPELGVAEALAILEDTSFSDDRYGALPNPRYGAGRIDAYAAVAEAALTSGVRGTVTDGKTREPLAGVTVTRGATGRSVTTDARGRFEFRAAAGTHDLTLTRFGYKQEPVRVRVTANRFTDLRVALDQTRRGRISGQVVYGPTGSTVPGATVTVLGVPDPLAGTTDLNGRYTIAGVPEGEYRISAVAPGVSRSAPAPVRVRTGTARADLALPKPPPTERISLSTDHKQGNSDAWWPRLSADGNHVTWASMASNLVPGDTNDDLDIFATDLRTGETERVSVASDGTQGDSFSLSPMISADGRYVGFNSGSANLVPGDTNGYADTFAHDRRTGKTERLSVAADGTQANDLSGPAAFSGDGRYAVFISEATNLVPGDTNGGTDVFVRDRVNGTIERVSVGAGGVQGDGSSREASISADGRYVAFQSAAANLVPEDTNGLIDVFVRDRETGAVERITAPDGAEAVWPVISADGQMVVFSVNLQIYLYDRRSRTTTLVSANADGTPSTNMALAPSLTTDGRTVAFYSYAGLVPEDTNTRPDAYVRDMTTGSLEWISTAPGGGESDGLTELPSISGDGRFVAFHSTSTDLVEGDTNRRYDIFVHDRRPGPEPRFALTGLDVSPATARPGRPVRITAWVKNIGEKPGPYDAALVVGGLPEPRRTFQVGAGKAVKLTFEVRRGSPGTYTVELGPLTGTLTVSRH
ncbi:S8 family serine peptidase [Sphaerisporangium aureirubrum]|uniref:alpha-amylase n=1 Tax=Sphaerisporangium aureirubrum TaxID=1544736 RepID=A0ABW1NPR0_9ACTN